MQDTAVTSREGDAAPQGAPAPASAGAAALPTLKDCATAVAVGGKTGVGSLTALEPEVAAQCPQIAAILQSATVRTQLESHVGHDSEAIEQQAMLKKDATIANLCLLGAGILSSLVLLVTALAPEAQSGTQPHILWLGILIIILGAIGTLFSHIAREQGRAGRWLAHRGEAEVARFEIFKETARQASEAGPSVAMYGLALIMIHLLNDQRFWMSGRASRHRKSSEVTSLLGGVAVALAFIGGSGAVIASQAPGTVWIVLAGTIGAALAAYAINREALHRDRANAERYEKARVALDGLAGRVDDIAARIQAGEPKALVAFTEAVADQLSTEHKQWLEGTAQADAVLEKLDGQLRQLSADRNEASRNRE
jgi:hypothetical protein